MLPLRVTTIVCLMLVRTAAIAAGQDRLPPAARQLIETGRLPWARWPDFARYVDDVARLYDSRVGQLIWLDGPSVSRQGHAAIAALLKAGEHGLDPDDYDALMLEATARRSVSSLLSPHERARLDVSLTVNLMRLLDDLETGRLHPGTLDPVPEVRTDLAGAIESAVAADSIAGLVTAISPQLAQYRNLQRQLVRYRRWARDSTLGPISVTAPVRRGDAFADVVALRRRLVLLGDLLPDFVGANAFYEGPDERAVQRFQVRHGLEANGVLDSATFAEINAPFGQRVRQIELAMERLRWLPPIGGQRFVVVNVPAFRLFAFDSAGGTGRPALSMLVIVGRALDKQTPMLYEQMRYIEFRPYWNVPRRILVEEVIPLLRSDSAYLRRNAMEVVGTRDAVVERSVTPELLDQLAAGALRVRQRPGPGNALGLIKFVFPNAAGVYLHGTPHPELFAHTRRDFSHGCIRLEDPTTLATWVLRDRPEWGPDRIRAAQKAATMSRAMFTRPMPVVIFYTTAVASPDGSIWFFSDVYGHDRSLDEALRAGPVTP